MPKEGQSLNLYAQWKALPVTIIYNGNGGKGNTNGETTDADTAIPIAPNGYTRNGYTFQTWNTKADGTGNTYRPGDSITLTGDITLYAQWQANRYTVGFDNNTGTGNMDDQQFVYDTEQKLNANKFTKPGYTFTGWNTSKTGDGTGYEDRQTVVNLTADNGGHVVLYAQWKANPSRIQYDKNSDKATGETADTVGVTDQTVAISHNGYQREGYTFTGWNTKADGSGTPYKPGDEIDLTADMTLYAQWQTVEYPLVYDLNGGTGTTPNG